jgi:Carboxypeptidase regulatory-like domain
MGVCLQGALALSFALALLPSRVLAQRGDSGSIVGSVFDQTGVPLPGVKVTATSETQIGGPRVSYTSAEGRFRFPVLDPGVFKLRAEAPRLATAVQNAVKVGINAPAEVDFVMEVATGKVEEVQVVERPPLVSTTSSSVKEVYDIDVVACVPTSRLCQKMKDELPGRTLFDPPADQAPVGAQARSRSDRAAEDDGPPRHHCSTMVWNSSAPDCGCQTAPDRGPMNRPPPG